MRYHLGVVLFIIGLFLIVLYPSAKHQTTLIVPEGNAEQVFSPTPSPSPEYTTIMPIHETEMSPDSSISGAIKQIEPILYQLDPSGTIKDISTAYTEKNKQLLSGLKIIQNPIITNDSESQRTHLFLESEEKQLLLTAKLIADAEEFSFNGYTLYFDNIQVEDLVKYERFIETIAYDLHQKKIKISIITRMTIQNEHDTKRIPDMNWKKIASVVDSLKFFAYDSPRSSYTFFISTLSQTIPAAKITIVLPVYGYKVSGDIIEYLSQSQITKELKKQSIQKEEDLQFFSHRIHLFENNTESNIWYEDRESIGRKIQQGQKLGINTFSLYTLNIQDTFFLKESN